MISRHTPRDASRLRSREGHSTGVLEIFGFGRARCVFVASIAIRPVGVRVLRAAELVAVVDVLAVRPGVAERLAALGTAVGLLAAVETLVFRQMVFVFERLAAEVTDERSLTYERNHFKRLANLHVVPLRGLLRLLDL